MNAGARLLAERYPLIVALFTTQLQWTLAAFAAPFALNALALYAALLVSADGFVTSAGPMIGGDFVVFRFAGSVAGTPEMLAIYDSEKLKTMLEAAHPGDVNFKFGWMYPPTMFLVVAPFAAPPFLASYALWVALFAGLFFLTLSRIGADRWSLFFIAASPAAYFAAITGQNGFLTAALIAAAGAFAGKKPVLAGIAAGLLTVKPHLGLLIPLAFVAGGHWRAFAAAAATAMLLAAVSVALFGIGPWAAFIDSVTHRAALMGGDGFIFDKLVSPFGLARMAGAPSEVAGLVQIAATLALAAYVTFVWRRVADWDLRAAALSTAALLATPYAFYYEAIIAAPAMVLVARRAMQTGFLRHEKLALIGVWILSLPMPVLAGAPALSVSLAALIAFAIVARRALPAALTSASATSPASAGS